MVLKRAAVLTLRTCRALLVHLTIDVVPSGSIVAGVESVQPPPGPVGGGSTAYTVSLGPGQGSVVAVLC